MRRLARILLAALLLAGQQAALAHALWHVAAAEQSKKTEPGRAPLCEQHAALGTVAGAISCAGFASTAVVPAAQTVATARDMPAAPASVSPSSRGPPALL